MKPKIGIIGYGYLGQAFEVAFKAKCDVYINDIAHENDQEKFFSKDDIVSLGMDMILIGVPTPYSKSKGFDSTIIDVVLNELNISAEEWNIKPLICIKSAVLPSYVRTLYRFENLIITVSPEYLSGKDNIRDMVNHEVLIVGGIPYFADRVINLFLEYSICNKNVKTGICTAQEAALIKYMENSFLALKCLFMSEFYELYQNTIQAQGYTSGFNEILEMWMLDSRMGNYPYKIPYHGELGYCSHCLCKDTQAIQTEGVDMPLMQFMTELNNSYRTKTGHGHNRCECTPGGVTD